MPRAHLDDIELHYQDTGAGDPVLFIHGALIADTFPLLLAQPALARVCRLITYRRRGYGDPNGAGGEIPIAQHAADGLALLRHLGLTSAHIVGHSLGGCIALQLALDAPTAVRSLSLLEPALAIGSTAHAYRETLALGIARYRDTPPELLVDQFLQARWPNYHQHLDTVLPGALSQAIDDLPATFQSDLPGLLAWRFTEHDAHRIARPTLSVLGQQSDALWPRFGETHRLLLDWIPDTEGFICPGSTHFLPLEQPGPLARALAAFLQRQTAP